MKNKNIFKCIALMAMMLALPLIGNAQKFALIDMEYILKNIPAYERANEQLNQATKKWQAEVEALNTEAPIKGTKESQARGDNEQGKGRGRAQAEVFLA